MAERERIGGRAAAWPQPRRAVRSLVLPRRFAALAQASASQLRAWIAAETGPGRLVLWIPVAFAGGVVLYFTAEREPALWAGALLGAACAGVTFALRRRPVGFAAALLATAMAGGFAMVTLKSARIEHPVLARPLFGVAITGWVLVREERERTDRIVIAVHQMEAARLDAPLERVRVAVRKGTAPPVGSFVSLKARLSPPLGPLRPGGYDFARDLYFQAIGATGFALGKIELRQPPAPPSLRLRFAAAISAARDAIDARIRAAIAGDAGAIASALITGKRDAISGPVNEAMYVSSLAHVLSISGYHMAVVAGVVFFIVRGLLALSAGLATRYPIKKWAAIAALAAATFYLVLSGGEIATQRAYVMTAVVLVGVLADRAALTLRTLAVAACALLLIAPEAVTQPSFQMSFAATLALVAAYERGLPWTGRADGTLAARIALWGGREIAMLLVASVVAGAATTLYAAYHFHRLAPYGVLANLLAMPVISAWVMPVGLLALVAAPFGFDAPLWRLMGQGIEWMIAVAVWVAAIPGAVGRVAAFGVGPLLLGSAGLIVICLLRSPLRWGGIGLAGIAVLGAMRTTPPDVLVAPAAEAVAVRTASGRLSVLKLGSDAFAIRHWLAADADPRPPGDPELSQGFACDAAACVARMADGRLVSVVFAPDAFAEDCRLAALVISRRAGPPECAAQVIDRTVWPETGAIALTRAGERFSAAAARPPGYDRPWSRRNGERRGAGATSAPSPAPAAPDATPRASDLAPDD